MEEKIKVYKTIGEFYDKLTMLKDPTPKNCIEFIGRFDLYQKPPTEVTESCASVNPFYLGSGPSSGIQVILCREFSSDDCSFNRYWIRWWENLKKPNEISAFYVPIIKDSWTAHHEGQGDPKVRGEVMNSKLIFELTPELKKQKRK